jgi:hypothetical protein
MPGVGLAPGGAMAVEDVGDLQPRAAHRRRATPRVSASPQAAVRAGRAGWSRCGSWCWQRACKAPWCRAWRGRATPRLSPGQALDDADVGVLFRQVGGEAVPQRVRRHSLVDPGGLGGGVNGAVELTGRERFDRIAARKQPAPRQQHAAAPALPPPGAQQLKQRRRQHGIAVPRFRQGRLLRPPAFAGAGSCPARLAAACARRSMSPTLSATTSETRRPAPPNLRWGRLRRCPTPPCTSHPVPPGAAA